MSKKKKKYNFSREYVLKSRTFPVGNTILLAVLLLAQIALIAVMISYSPTPKDIIKDYTVTVEPHEDGTLDIAYDLVWEVVDASEPLSWVSIGMANEHYTVYPDTVSEFVTKKKHIVNDGYTALELHFNNYYYTGTINLSFKVHQEEMLCRDINGYFYEFVPCWFNEIPVEHYTFRWKSQDGAFTAQSCADGYYIWEGSLECGDYQMMTVRYEEDTFTDAQTVAYIPFDDSGAFNGLREDKITLSILLCLPIALLAVLEVIIVDSYVSYGRGRGFLSGYGHPIHTYGRANPRYHAAAYTNSTTHHHGGFSGGGGCACACACACAGGGRAGCSQKDTVHFSTPKTLSEELHAFVPVNEQEARDQELILQYLAAHPDCLSRNDATAHITVSAWTVNKEFTKTLMVYHKVYDSWSWIGGHADGDSDLKAVALRELSEETGVADARIIGDGIFSLEILPVNGHFKKGVYIPSHLHLNVTYLAVADETSLLSVNENENTGVKWFAFEDACRASTEPWMVETVYRKLIAKTAGIA